MVGLAHTLTYGGISSSDYGIFISGEGVYNAPERNVELVSVPGRNGDLTIDKGSFANITIEYPCFTFAKSQAEFRRKVNDFKNALMSQVGYQKLADDYHPDDYRMALYINGLEVDPVHMGRAGSFTLQFICKPQRYLVNGEDEVTVNDGDVINNPTLYDAEPLLKIEGYGDVEFNGYKVTVENATMGDVVMFNKGVKSDSIGYITSYSISKTLTFDKSPFNNGDSFSFDFSETIQAFVSNVATVSQKTHTGNGVDSEKNLGDSLVSVTNTLTSTHAIGTASTNTDAFTIKYYDGSTYQYTLTITSAYDGDETITLTGDVTTQYDSHFMVQVDLSYSSAVGTSSLPILGNPTYVDCEIGEAYKYENGSLVGLNSYIDLGSDLPKLSSGNNTFTIDNTITSLIIVPRYWQL